MRKIILHILCLTIYSTNLFAQAVITDQEKKAITSAVERIAKQVGKKLPVTEIRPSLIPGLFQVTSDLNVFYISKSGEFALFGDMIDTNKSKDDWSVTDQVARELRRKVLAGLKEQDMIIFPATAPKVGNAYVFTDLDCPYCHKMQDNIKKYTDKGIEIRYLAFPRSGPKTPSFDKAITVWCAKDKAAAYDATIEDPKNYVKNTCVKNPVQMEYELGERMGVNGTPTIFLDNGSKLGGLVDAKTLLKMIQEQKK